MSTVAPRFFFSVYGSVMLSPTRALVGSNRGDSSSRTPAWFVGTRRWFSPVPPPESVIVVPAAFFSWRFVPLGLWT